MFWKFSRIFSFPSSSFFNGKKIGRSRIFSKYRMVVCIFAYCFSTLDEMDRGRNTCRLFHPLYPGITRTCTNHEMEERVLGVERGAGNPRILASGQRNRFPWNFECREPGCRVVACKKISLRFDFPF